MTPTANACPVCLHNISVHSFDRVAIPCTECADIAAHAVRWTCGMTVADIAYHYQARAETDCRTCGGTGEVRHPRWGASNCPEPTAVCPTCKGERP